MPHPRRLLIILLGVFVVAGVLWWVARIYLSSSRITAQVASRLQAAYGAPVQVREARIGVRGSSLHDLQIFEANASSGEAPWLVIERAEADILLWDLIQSGALPSQLTLSGVSIKLRFDKAGHLLTHIPTAAQMSQSLPEIKIDSGQITVQQEGRPDFVVTGVHTDVHDQNRRLALTGTVADPSWGEWTMNGSVGPTEASATLKSSDVHVRQSMLERIPFVPGEIWQHVRVNGESAVDCTVRYDPAAKEMHYRITLEPRATEVAVPRIELHADHGQGRIIVEDGIVNVVEVRVRAADGEIKATGRIDLAPPELDFKVDASNLQLDKLPKSWELPPWGGRLNGHADLQVALVKGKIQTNGSGQGTITGVRIPGAPKSKPILLTLHPTGEGFRFSSQAAQFRLNSPLTPAAMSIVALLLPQQPKPRADSIPSPAEFVNFVGTGLLRGIDALARAGSDAIGRLPKRGTGAAEPQETPSYLEAQLGLDDVDVAQLVAGLHIPLPFPVTGRISFNVKMAIPVNRPRDLKAYRLQGTVSSRQFTMADQEVDDLRARMVYADGILRLGELSGQVPARAPADAVSVKAGSFNGTAQLQVIPQGDFTARLALEGIPLDRALAFMPGMAGEASGTFSGNIDSRAPAAKLKDIAAWEAVGAVSAKRLELYGLTLDDAAVPLRVHQGVASIQEAQGRLAGTPLTISAELRLTNVYPFTGTVHLQKADLTVLRGLSSEMRLPVSLGGQLDVTADIKGTLRPFVVQTFGSGTADNLTVEQVKIGTSKFRWQSDADRVNVNDIQAHLYGSELSGSAVLPLRPSVAGNVDVGIRDLDVGALSRDVPKMPVQLEGRASGRLEGTLNTEAPGQPRQFRAKLELQAPQLRVQGIPTERLRASVDYRDKTLTYRMESETLGGRFHLDGQIPSANSRPAGQEPEGHLRLEKVQLGRLARALLPDTALRSLRGVVNLDLRFRHAGAQQKPVGGGSFTLDRLRWGGTVLADSLSGDVLLAERELRLRRLAGEFAGGQLRAQIVVNLEQINRSWFTLAMDQVEAARLLGPWPALADQVAAALQVRLRGTLGRKSRGGGDIVLARGRVSGLEVVDWLVPLDWAFAPGSGQIEIRESTGHVALGRAVTRASLTWGSGLQVQGQIRFFGVNLRTLLRQATELSQMGTGQISGRFDFAGNDVRSLDDLTGTLDARLQQTQALQLPVLQQLAPFLIAGQSSTSVFQNGSLRGGLGRGVFRIDQLTFAGTMLQLFIDGTITLQGRLNLEVTANTAALGANPNFLRFLGLRLPAVGPIPVSLLMEATTYFSNRLVHLRVTGTLRSPIVTVGPLSLLTGEALRFFVNRSTLPLP
jgi:translocation and assembly module TamB